MEYPLRREFPAFSAYLPGCQAILHVPDFPIDRRNPGGCAGSLKLAAVKVWKYLEELTWLASG
jgi:hypothetical protein